MATDERPFADDVAALCARIKRESGTPRWKLAHEIHRRNGHPKGYVGPCWGPLPEEWAEADRRLAKERTDA